MKTTPFQKKMFGSSRQRGSGQFISLDSLAAYTILTITNDGGGNALITTAGPHGLEGTPPITVSGNSVAGYNVEHSVDSIPSTTTLVTNQTYTSNGTGGTWAPA